MITYNSCKFHFLSKWDGSACSGRYDYHGKLAKNPSKNYEITGEKLAIKNNLPRFESFPGHTRLIWRSL